MTQISRETEQVCLQFTNATIKEAYNHIVKLAKSKFKEPIKTLKSRHHGYEEDDFIQETMQIILTESTRKKFPTINHLKSFINLTMQYHYLKEKRKYFYTRQRGDFTEVSIFDSTTQTSEGKEQLIAETLTYDKEEVAHLSEEIDLDSLIKRNLYVVYDWKSLLEICKASELRNYTVGYALSVNHLIKTLRAYGAKDACKVFKEQGFFMTRRILDDISQKLIQYIKDNQLLEVSEDTTYKEPYKNILNNERFKYVSNIIESSKPLSLLKSLVKV